MAAVLAEVTVAEIVSGKRKLVFVEAHDSLEHALALLREHNILAMPVRTQEARADAKTAARELNFCGLLSVLDVAAFVARDPEACGKSGEGVEVASVMKKTAESWHMLLLDPHATVARAMEYLGVRGFHRALVPNVCLAEHGPDDVPLPSALVEDLTPHAKGEEYRVLSQVDLARFILAHEGRFGLALSVSIESVGLDGGKVLATTKEELLSDALDRMAGHAVSALAVVEKLEEGAPWAATDAGLLGTLSASDLRGCSFEDLKSAHSISVGDFLARRHGQAPREQLTCTRHTEIRAVLSRMVESGVHRLWVMAEPDSNAPGSHLPVLGVTSLSDVVRVMHMLPVTDSSSSSEELVKVALDNFMRVEWMA